MKRVSGGRGFMASAVSSIEETAQDLTDNSGHFGDYIRTAGPEPDRDDSWLGRYWPMKDGVPGNIVLHRANLARFVRDAWRYLFREGHMLEQYESPLVDLIVLAPVLPHVILLPDASPPMLPAGFWLLGFEGFFPAVTRSPV